MTADAPVTAELCVLASGSAGNCSVLTFAREGVRRACLIDLGLSPRRTVRLLGALGLALHHIDDVVLTHLDTDHFHAGWAKALPRQGRIAGRLLARRVAGCAFDAAAGVVAEHLAVDHAVVVSRQRQ